MTLGNISKLVQGKILRYTVMIVLAVLVAHYISYRKLPFFEYDYTFPVISFAIVLVFGVVICESNTLIYHNLNNRIPFGERNYRRLVLQYSLTLGSTVLIFWLLYLLINRLIFEQPYDFFDFSLYLGICLFISGFESTFYTVNELIRANRLQQLMITKMKEADYGVFTFKSNIKTVSARYKDIAYIFSSKGIVTVFDKEGSRYISNFTSFNEMPNLPKSRFYRVNRQLIINKSIIKSFETCEHRKTKLQIVEEYKNGFDEIIISRYKSASFKKWYG